MLELDNVVLDTPGKGKPAAPKQRQAATKKQRKPRYKSVGAITMPEMDPDPQLRTCRRRSARVGWPGRKRPTVPETAMGMLSELPNAREADDYVVKYE